MTNIEVAIVKGTDPRSMVFRALEMINAETHVRQSNDVLIKPNCVAPKDPSTGVTTDSRVVEAIIEFLRDKGVHALTIGEGGNRHTDKTFVVTGLHEVAARHGVRLVNFNTDQSIEIEIPSAKVLTNVAISKTVLASTCMINVPTLKIHHMCQVTLAAKNLMGVIVGDRGAIMHRHVDEKLVDLASFVKPKLNVIDGLVGSEMDEVQGTPVQMNVIIAGTSVWATDAVGCAVMGVNPKSVRHLQLAAERGFGVIDLDAITVLGDPIRKVRKVFRRGFTKGRLKNYGFEHDVSETIIRPLWESMRSNLSLPKR
jgi:uncharacterized protein (DUF362 family)